MNEKVNSILAGSRSLAPELRALLIRYAALDLLIDQEAVEGGDPHALANAKLVQAELRIVKDRVEAYIAAVREGKSALYAARR